MQGMNQDEWEIACAAAALIVDEGQDYGSAKRRAVQNMGLPPRTPLPSNDVVEAAVREHIALFCADTQPAELRALRELALQWMQRLKDFEPLLAGAVWHGTATRLSDVYLQVFSDDCKAVELALINQGVDYQAQEVNGLHDKQVSALSIAQRLPTLQAVVGVHVLVNDTLAQRGALLPDAQGRKPRGTLKDVEALLASTKD
jgi:hypothetical protein